MARLTQRLAKAAGEKPEGIVSFLGEGSERFARVPVVSIEPDPDQPRKHVGDIEGLKASIREHGIIQPIVVSPHGEELFRIIAGERRFTAAKEIGLETVPAIIRTIEEHRRLEIQIIENIHRQELSPFEEAQAYRRLLEEFKLSQRDLGTRVGKSAASINETLRILSLPEDLHESVRTSERLTRSVLLEIAKEEVPETQRALLHRALTGQLTVKTLRESKQKQIEIQETSSTSLKLSNATITIRFRSPEFTQEDIRKALNEALESLNS